MRFVRVSVDLADVRSIDDKCKVRACLVEVEVDRFGDVLALAP